MSNWRDFLLNGCIIAAVVLISILVYFYSKGDCPIGTMSCSSGGLCVPHGKICNEHNDCPDGEDENPVLCSDLTGSTNLLDEILNRSLIENAAITYKECDIKNHPLVCRCAYKSKVYCNHAQFKDIPQDISKGVTYLGLQNNSIRTLKKDSLNVYNLTLLQLENNELHCIEPGAFEQQNYLKKLFLMNNELSVLKPGVFTGLTSLEWLHMDNNKLKTIYFSNFEILIELKWLNMSHNELTFDDQESFPFLPKLLELYLNNNKLRFIANDTFSNLTGLDLLNLRSNSIRAVDIGAFANLKQLKELDLSNNFLRSLHHCLFISQGALGKLSIGNNPISVLHKDLFINLQNLLSLHLEEIDITNIHTDIFASLTNLQWIYFKTYKYCTYVPTVPRCRPLSDGISSINQLLFKPIFRYSNWIMCIITIGGNSLVLFGRFLFRDENKNLSVVIKNLAVSDGLMGIYLLIIAYHDLKYRDNYNEIARKWMSSWNCVITGIIGMTSLEVSVMILVFLSVDRYFVITMPYKKYGSLTLKETWRVILCIWCFGICISVIPALGLLSSTKFYGVNGLCLPLYIDEPYLIGWEYSAIIFFGINAPSLLIIIYTYGGMFINIKNTRNATSMPMNDCQFAIRFFFIVLANIACWVPIITAKMLVYLKVDISGDFYAWLVVFVLPINSSLNPILYTFTTRKYRRRILKVPSCLKKFTTVNNLTETHLPGAIFKITQKDIKTVNN
ncbi:relaxin receptor 2 [Dendroctonus ponderosae]|uniref:relaxin receptor 2 n=1 Tax=Dendroctonus ponderosae TaxID=77166 RepID=UPI002035C9E0|nr:relaxin receptor 2 [Dendroctonus ponderosae]KAH1029514.1 hypothetical protein HUJ05_002740 [Dendroctonus ponderosae]